MIEIIKAEERHIPDISKLWWEFMEYSASIDPIFTPEKGSMTVFEKEHLRPAMADKNSLILVASDKEKAVGYSYSLIADSALEARHKNFGIIHDLFITKDYRCKGIGVKMYEEILKWLKAGGVRRVELGVIDANQVACSFWKKLGYRDFQSTLCNDI